MTGESIKAPQDTDRKPASSHQDSAKSVHLQPPTSQVSVEEPVDLVHGLSTARSPRKWEANELDRGEREQPKGTSPLSTPPTTTLDTRSAATATHICLCQPDPKIPRPRNGKYHLFKPLY